MFRSNQNNIQINEAQVFAEWSPVLEESTGIADRYKLSWMSKYAHFHRLNESFTWGNSSTLANTIGIGGVNPAAAPSTQSAFYTASNQGSGDLFPLLLPMALQVATKTIGMDLVQVIPMSGPSGTLVYLEPTYGGGTVGSGSKPLVIMIDANNINSTAYVVGTQYWGVSAVATNGTPDAYASGVKAVELIFIGYSFVNHYPMFRVGQTYKTDGSAFSADDTLYLTDIFDGSAIITTDDSGEPLANDTATAYVSVSTVPDLVSAYMDHIRGYAGAGTSDTNNWSGSFAAGTEDIGSMSRATGEKTYSRPMGLRLFSKNVAAGTIRVHINVTQEDVTDLNKQFGVDALNMCEEALVNELAQEINAHILHRIFALGWQNNYDLFASQSVTYNMTVDPAQSTDITSTTAGTNAFRGKSEGSNLTVKIPKWQAAGGFENMNTLQARIMGRVLAAMNIIATRGKRGNANFVVTNTTIATALQVGSQYTFAPIRNTINQDSGSLYPVGTIANLTVYVDPNMALTDNRVVLGRKGGDNEPGIKFMPYLIAESVRIIAENTMAPKIQATSRYALVEAGFNPQLYYYTFFVHTGTLGVGPF